jgi:hypothetical protein
MNNTSSLACFCLCFACFASAQDIQDRCRTATSQTELNRCWSQAAADSERDLSKAYIKTLARVQDPKNPGVASMSKQAQIGGLPIARFNVMWLANYMRGPRWSECSAMHVVLSWLSSGFKCLSLCCRSR